VIDRDDFALIGAIFGSINQTSAQSILADVVPFLAHALIVAQEVIEEPSCQICPRDTMGSPDKLVNPTARRAVATTK
jgi:hypothetical protein